jgi:nicotinamide-nucleotide amidase
MLHNLAQYKFEPIKYLAMTEDKKIDTCKKLVDEAGKLLLKKKTTIAVAESVTSGNIQAIFSLAENATVFFQGGITVYNIGQKCRHLLVEPTHAIDCNCVSKKVSDQMAIEVCHLFSADYGIGITGYASPIPEKNISKLHGFVSIAKNNRIIASKKINAQPSEAREAQLFYTEQAVSILISILKK